MQRERGRERQSERDRVRETERERVSSNYVTDFLGIVYHAVFPKFNAKCQKR